MKRIVSILLILFLCVSGITVFAKTDYVEGIKENMKTMTSNLLAIFELDTQEYNVTFLSEIQQYVINIKEKLNESATDSTQLTEEAINTKKSSYEQELYGSAERLKEVDLGEFEDMEKQKIDSEMEQEIEDFLSELLSK